MHAPRASRLACSRSRRSAKALIFTTKTATIPAVRVEPQLRAEVESLLDSGKTLSKFVEDSVRAAVERRRHQSEFVARGLRSLEEARQSDDCVDADEVVASLERKLDAARTDRKLAPRL